jgi:predicted DNA-binding transcriptional regulator AlpA
MSGHGSLQLQPDRVERVTRSAHIVSESCKYMTLAQVLARIGCSRWTWWRWVKAELAPKPAPLPGHPRWRVSDIDRFETGRTHQRIPLSRFFTHGSRILRGSGKER